MTKKEIRRIKLAKVAEIFGYTKDNIYKIMKDTDAIFSAGKVSYIDIDKTKGIIDDELFNAMDEHYISTHQPKEEDIKLTDTLVDDTSDEDLDILKKRLDCKKIQEDIKSKEMKRKIEEKELIPFEVAKICINYCDSVGIEFSTYLRENASNFGIEQTDEINKNFSRILETSKNKIIKALKNNEYR